MPAMADTVKICGLYGSNPCQKLAKMSSKLADFRGSTSYSSAMFLAKGPVIRIEIVLLAVAISAALTNPAIPNSAPFFCSHFASNDLKQPFNATVMFNNRCHSAN